MSHMTRRLRGSSPVVGSSRKMIRGSPTRVIARSSRRRMPPDQVWTGRSAASTRSNRSSRPRTRAPAGSRDRGGADRPSGGGSRSPVNCWSTADTWPVRPISRRTASGSPDDVHAANEHLARVRREERREDVDRRRLAGTVRPQQGEDRARSDVEVDPVEDDAVAERLAQAADPDGGDRQRGAARSSPHPPGGTTGATPQMSRSSTVGWRAARATMSNSSAGTFSRSSSRVVDDLERRFLG